VEPPQAALAACRLSLAPPSLPLPSLAPLSWLLLVSCRQQERQGLQEQGLVEQVRQRRAQERDQRALEGQHLEALPQRRVVSVALLLLGAYHFQSYLEVQHISMPGRKSRTPMLCSSHQRVRLELQTACLLQQRHWRELGLEVQTQYLAIDRPTNPELAA
jgi:hypothetical protein